MPTRPARRAASTISLGAQLAGFAGGRIVHAKAVGPTMESLSQRADKRSSSEFLLS